MNAMCATIIACCPTNNRGGLFDSEHDRNRDHPLNSESRFLGQAQTNGQSTAQPRRSSPAYFCKSDANKDLAVLTISTDISHALGIQPYTINPVAKPGNFTLVGFDNGEHLVWETEPTAISKVIDSGAWTGSFYSASSGTSGGPLLTANNQVVGIQSFNSLFFGDFADHITLTQLQDIDHWAHIGM